MSKPHNAKILFLDIETAPIIAHVWRLFDENIGLNQIKQDWHLLSWAAKWEGSSRVMYADQRSAKKMEDDSAILRQVWELLDEADIVVGQNSTRFDVKKLNARFVMNGMKPPSSFRQIDTLKIAKKHFGFTSNKLEYMTDKLCKTYKKLSHKKFSGFELWRECLAGNTAAWREMEIYNKHDVLALEELYHRLKAWDSSINFNVYHKDHLTRCSCGSEKLEKKGYAYSSIGKYQRFICTDCGKNHQSKYNEMSPKKRRELLK